MVEIKGKPRPYWHVDAKWVFGILFSNFLVLTTVLFILTTLTSEKVAVPLASLVVASQFSKNGLDDSTDIDEVKQKFLNSGQEKFYPFGSEQNVFLTREDVVTLSPRELRLKIFRQVVEPIYYQKITKESMKEYGFLTFINIQTHNMLNRFFLISIVPLILMLSGLTYFSYRYGRLISPALTFLLFGAPASNIFFLLTNTKSSPGEQGPVPFLPREVLVEIINPISGIFYFYTLLGVVLIMVALALKLFTKFKKTKTT